MATLCKMLVLRMHLIASSSRDMSRSSDRLKAAVDLLRLVLTLRHSYQHVHRR